MIGERMNTSAFSECIQNYIRASGYSQKELADEIGLHPKVLSRKLNHSGKAYLTHHDIHRIVITLANWRAISTQDEAIHLLELAHIGPNHFSSQEWQQPPLNHLLPRKTETLVSQVWRVYIQRNWEGRLRA